MTRVFYLKILLVSVVCMHVVYIFALFVHVHRLNAISHLFLFYGNVFHARLHGRSHVFFPPTLPAFITHAILSVPTVLAEEQKVFLCSQVTTTLWCCINSVKSICVLLKCCLDDLYLSIPV